MGSGKSHIAREVARISSEAVFDTDAAIVSLAGCPIAQFFAAHGEAEFRRIEAKVLLAALQQGGIISTGGGIVTRPDNCAILQKAVSHGALIVYLRAKPETLAARIRLQPGARPLIDGVRVLNLEETVDRVREILNSRSAAYESVATCIVDTDGRLPQDIAAEIWHHFKS
jgi:shikimate kinase